MAVEFDREEAHQFLTGMYLGLPGLIQICSTGDWAGRCFSTDVDGIRAAVAYAEDIDNVRRPKGIYFRATTLKSQPAAGARGGAEDTLSIPFFWNDLDFGTTGHSSANLPPTAEAAIPLIAEAGLPEASVIIHSGGGYYHLWKTAGWFTPAEAATMSVRIQAWIEHASKKHGWSYGTGVSDLARVLRLPGSINRKADTERPCRVIGGTGHDIGWSCFPKDMPAPPAKPVPAIPAPRREPSSGNWTGGKGVFDALAETASWADILEPAGWTYVDTDSKGELWLRSGGADSEYSSRCFEFNMVCHSEAAGLPSGKGQRLTKGRVWAWLNGHEDDLSAAAIALIKGEHDLPDAVRDAIKKTVAEQVFDNVRAIGPTAATDDELESWVASFTAHQRPDRLARHIGWAVADAPRKLPRHAERMVVASITGSYPAEAVVLALATVCQHHGVADPDAPRALLASALGATLVTLEAAVA